MHPPVPELCVRPPVDGERAHAATVLPRNAPAYTLLPSGLIATTSAPSSPRAVEQPGIDAAARQPVPSVACVSAPVDGSRVKISIELLRKEVAYTFFPSGLTATELGPSRAMPLAHPPAPPAAIQPAAP